MGRKLNLKHLREGRGWTQRQLAEKVGVNPSAVAHWELGTKLPTLNNLFRLATLFNRTVDELFVKDEEQAPA